ncbi:MAG: hypothetical protein KH972_07275 [Peptostreptococcaceae bacterium]|nr:hypothetical protein [Peptostreptococcaceae bacterium]
METKEFNKVFLSVATKYAQCVESALDEAKTKKLPLEESKNIEMSVRLVNTLAVTVDRISNPNSAYLPQA